MRHASLLRILFLGLMAVSLRAEPVSLQFTLPPAWLVPTELNLDPVDGYPINNGVHPNGVGYAQIGTSFYAWLKAWLATPKPI